MATKRLMMGNVALLATAMLSATEVANASRPVEEKPKPEPEPERQMTPEELATELSRRLQLLKDGVDQYNQFRKALNNGWKEFKIGEYTLASNNLKNARKMFKRLLGEAGLKAVPVSMPEEISKDEEYDAALKRFEEIKDSPDATPEATEAAMLSIRLYEYEKKFGKPHHNEP